MHRNANYACRECKIRLYGHYTKTSIDCLFISIYLLIIHLEISIQNISLVLSCEPQPYVANPKQRTTALTLYVECKQSLWCAVISTAVLPLIATTHSLVACFCHSSRTSGGMNPLSSIMLRLGVTTYYLAKAINYNGEHAWILKNTI